MTDQDQERRVRREGLGTRDIPRVLRGDWRTLASRMRDNGWTFEGGRKHGVTAFAPYWVQGGVSSISVPGTPGDVRSYRNCRSVYRRWCRENGLEPNI